MSETLIEEIKEEQIPEPRPQGVYGEDVLVHVWVIGANKSRWWPGIIVGTEQTSDGKRYDVLLAYWDQGYPMSFEEKYVRLATANDRSELKE
jgi:hypothetical protein